MKNLSRSATEGSDPLAGTVAVATFATLDDASAAAALGGPDGWVEGTAIVGTGLHLVEDEPGGGTRPVPGARPAGSFGLVAGGVVGVLVGGFGAVFQSDSPVEVGVLLGGGLVLGMVAGRVLGWVERRRLGSPVIVAGGQRVGAVVVADRYELRVPTAASGVIRQHLADRSPSGLTLVAAASKTANADIMDIQAPMPPKKKALRGPVGTADEVLGLIPR